MSRTALFVSPHLDDAVFSCGATIARLARAGCDVVVATVFTASVPDARGFALACQTDKGIAPEVDYMALRRAEDEAACTLLGARPLWLGLSEAPHRGYDSADALFGPRRAEDPALAALARPLGHLLDILAPEAVFGPEGIGGHVDHLVVRDALDALVPDGWIRWRDQPYAWKTRAPSAGAARAVPVADALDAKCRAAAAYASQIGFQFGDRTALDAALSEAAWADGRIAAGRRAGPAEPFSGAVEALPAILAPTAEVVS